MYQYEIYLIYDVRTSLYMIFFVNISFASFFFRFPFPLFTSFSAAGTAKILMFDLAVALDSATYNWPCENRLRHVHHDVRDGLPLCLVKLSSYCRRCLESTN
jgi:hypothetical protein